MSGLPRANSWLIDEAKLAGYLLSEQHPTGGPKAAFLLARGFRRERPDELAGALRRHAERHSIAKTVGTRYGTKFVIEGALEAPDGSAPRIRAVWIVLHDETVPRFLSAYPLGRRR